MTIELGSLMLGTTDVERLHRWYTSVLPPDLDERQGDYRVLRYGAFWLFLDQRDDVQDAHPDAARAILNFDVSDARKVVAAMESAGTQWISRLEDRDGSFFATAQDPDGNYVQIIQMSPEHLAEMGFPPLAGSAGIGSNDAFSGFSVDDLDAAETFYGETLGLAVRRLDAPMELLALQLGNRHVLIYPKGGDHTPATYTVLNFPSEDVQASVRGLTERGIEFLRYDGLDQDDLGISTGAGPLIAWFTDPAGNVLSVIERGESS